MRSAKLLYGRSEGPRNGVLGGQSCDVPVRVWTCGLNTNCEVLMAGRSPRRDSLEHALDAYVFVNLRPAYARTSADDLESRTLLRSRLGKPPGPCQRNTNCPTVHQVGSNRVFSNRNTLNTSVDVNRNSHAAPPFTSPRRRTTGSQPQIPFLPFPITNFPTSTLSRAEPA
jgi:hypothetical protein